MNTFLMVTTKKRGTTHKHKHTSGERDRAITSFPLETNNLFLSAIHLKGHKNSKSNQNDAQ